MARQLTERRADDREVMAQLIEQLCARHGVQCERSEYHGPREIRLEIECEGLRVGVDFDGDNCRQLLDNYCLPWHMSHDSDRRLSGAFGLAQGAEVNPFHRRKCTTFARGIEQLQRQLADAFHMLRNGTAFVPEQLAA